MDLAQRISKFNPEQKKLLELKLKQQGIDIPQIPISQEYRKHYSHGFPLSLEQEPMWVIEKLDTKNPSYDIAGPVILEGDLNIEVLEKSINEVIKRHEILRVVFKMDQDKPTQVIPPSLTLRLGQIDFKDLPPGEQEAKMKELRESPDLYLFDMSKGPLVKTLLVRLGEHKYIFITVMHHIVSDLLSLKLFLKEVNWFYRSFLLGGSPGFELTGLSFQYVDYACWQQYWYRESILGIETRKRQEAFWLDMFSGEVPVLRLPADYPRPALKSYEGSHGYFSVKEEELRILKEIFLKENTTLYLVLLSVYYVFLAKISGQEDIVVGTPINSRQNKALNNMIGLFVKTVPLRNYPCGDKTFRNFLDEISHQVFQVYKNQEYSYEELVRNTLKERDASRNPLFDVLFNFIYLDMKEIEMPLLELKPYRFKTKRVGFDLELICEGTYEELFFKLSYSTKLFKEETIQRFISYFREILGKVIRAPDVRISALEIIPPEEKEQILFTFNNTTVDYQREKTVIQLVEERVSKNPGHIATSFANHFLSYGALLETYSRLAGLLKAKGVGPEVIVGLMAERSLGMLVGMLGILKTGGAYLPIDPGLPQERINYMLSDSKTKFFLAASGVEVKVKAEVEEKIEQPQGLHLRIINRENLSSTSTLTSTCQDGSASLAYVIYTSGSTGKPKGVTITQRNVINFMHGMKSVIGFSSGKAILALTTLSFDILVLETLLPLVEGSKVVIAAEEQQKDPQLLAQKLATECLNMVQLTPSALKLLINANISLVCLKNVEILMVGGERFPRELLERLRLDFPGHIYNMYGPTETTVWSTVKDLTASEKITIGYPISNTQVYILDNSGHMQPIGILGELCIGGDGTARGYLNRPELTVERFIATNEHGRSPTSFKQKFLHSKSVPPGRRRQKLYRTGDLARWLPAGDIEFFGRMDYQVKIRGFRIELEEIEVHLKRHEGIAEVVAVVKTRDNGDNFLCAYYIPENPVQDQGVFVLELREFLAAEVPDYMVPSFFVPLEKIPLTHNGKIHRKALPEPSFENYETKKYIAPSNQIQTKLAGIWSEILTIEKNSISIDTNFFHLGGHSLKAAEMISKIHKELNVKLPLAQIFKTPNIKGLSDYIRGMAQDKYLAMEPVEKKEYYPLSSIQKRFFTFQKLNHESTAYNIPILLRLEGDLQQHRFAEVSRNLIHRHETLRTSFKIIAEEPVQKIHDKMAVELKIEYYDPLSLSPSLPEFIKTFIRPFDMGKAPLLRLGFIKLAEKKHILMFDLHHIVGDGTSLNLLIKDFSLFYSRQQPESLKIQYKDFCEWQNYLLTSGKLKKHQEYWLNHFSGNLPLLNMPTDYPRPELQSFAGNQIHFYFEEELTQKLKGLMRKTGTTLYMVLLALYNILLNKYTLQEDIIIGSPISCRSHVDLEKIIGLLIETIAIRNYPQEDKTFTAFLEEVKDNTLTAFEHQVYPFRELVKQVGNENNRSRNPIFDAMLTVQNLEGSLPGGQIADIKLIPYEDVSYQDTKVDLSLTVKEKEEKIFFHLEYCTDLFKKETMARFVNVFREITTTVIDNKEIKLKDIKVSYDLVTAESSLYQGTQSEFEF